MDLLRVMLAPLIVGRIRFQIRPEWALPPLCSTAGALPSAPPAANLEPDQQ